jgi:hypothetical protein
MASISFAIFGIYLCKSAAWLTNPLIFIDLGIAAIRRESVEVPTGCGLERDHAIADRRQARCADVGTFVGASRSMSCARPDQTSRSAANASAPDGPTPSPDPSSAKCDSPDRPYPAIPRRLDPGGTPVTSGDSGSRAETSLAAISWNGGCLRLNPPPLTYTCVRQL